jgi:hypothetical protein
VTNLMRHLRFKASSEPCDNFLLACDEQADFFNSPDWHQVTHYLGAKTVYLWNEDIEDGFSASLFRIGPFAIAYLGFPIGTRTISTIIDQKGLLDSLIHSCLSLKVNAVRVSGLPQKITIDKKYQTASVVETEIKDLQNWNSVDLGSSIKRNIRKARKTNVRFSDHADVIDSTRIFSLYLNTVNRHGGAARYNIDYFSKLVEIANETNSPITIHTAFLDAELIAYTVVVDQQDTSMYLHGAQDMSYQKLRCMDALFQTMIDSAKLRGLKKFTFLGSPPNQTSLIKYKEKWGAKSIKRDTVTVFGDGMMSMVLKIILKIRG